MITYKTGYIVDAFDQSIKEKSYNLYDKDYE